jgi:mannose-6-phosphate isomerase-like protein (cupin superfamily)
VTDRHSFHHRRLPRRSALLSGRFPPSDLAFQSESLQVWFNETTEAWADDRAHFHTSSDEMFVVLEGTLVVPVEDRRVRVEAGQFCSFEAGLMHRIVSTEPPLRTLMIRAPSLDDKVYAED